MIEIRWVWNDFDGGTTPPSVSINVGDDSSRLIQKLQYRYRQPELGTNLTDLPQEKWEWSEWKDVINDGRRV